MKKSRILSVILAGVFFCTCFPVVSGAQATGKPLQRVANIVLFGYFSDTTDEEAIAYYTENTATIIKYLDGPQGRSFKNYINQISYGQMEIENIIPQYDGVTISPVKIDVSESYAATYNSDSQIINALVNAMPDISDKTVDFDGDGIIDNIMLIVKASTEGASGSSLVSHKSNYSGVLSINGKRLSPYNLLATGRILSDGAGVISHEFLHTLGYADLYTNNGGGMPVHVWSIMASVSYNPNYPLAFERMYFTNWITIDEITESTSLTLDVQSNPDGNQAFILKSPFNDREIFVIEYRVRPPRDYTNNDTLDYFIGGSGVIVYRVNLDATGLSNMYGETGIYVFRPQEGTPGYSTNEQTSVYNAYFPYSDATGTRNSIGSSDISKTLSDGALTFSNGSNSGIEIKNIRLSADGKQAFCDVTIPKKEDYDLWTDLDFVNSSIGSSNSVTFETVENSVYAVTAENDVIYSKKYENGQWSTFAENLSCKWGDNFKLVRIDDYLYLSFTSYDASYNTNMYLYRYNLTTGGVWQSVTTVSGALYSSIGAVGGELYAVCIDMDYSAWKSYVHVKKLNGNTLADIGVCSNDMAGDPKIVDFGGNVCISYRKSDNTVEAFEYADGTFRKITDGTMSASVYDVVSDGDLLYFALSGGELRVAVYDGIGWDTSTLADTASTEVGIAEKNGQIFVLSSPQSNGSLNAYSFSDGTFTLLGSAVDNASKKITAKFVGDTLFTSYIRSGDNLIFFKSKSVPFKVDYDIDENGVLNSNDYALLRDYVLCQTLLKKNQLSTADINSDGAVDAFDVIMLDVVLNS